ncbi:hypothetical protein [Rhizobium mesoamericanum]|uniref:Uncharacterized protein n=1 Tax=Rhizobium mesoamericanum STM3625 TaxID=1211777 RepID=K0PY68_9HYPH|nr:hypothetical protein [Rhizobium mesoamericanum]CCM74869.1 hypothetical protein BN77_2014 [Rhizobium mesoamericanum STM3625]
MLANAANPPPGLIDALAQQYGGAPLGRRELDGDLIEDRDDALWRHIMIEAATIRFTGEVSRTVVAVEPTTADGLDRASNAR